MTPKEALNKIWRDAYPKACETWSADKFCEHWGVVEKALNELERLKKFKETFEVGDVVYNGNSKRPLTILRKAWVVCYQDTTAYEHFVEEGDLSKTKTLQKITEKELADMGYMLKR